MAYNAGAIVSEIKSNISDFKAGIKKAKGELDNFGDAAKRNAQTIKQAGMAVTAFAGAVGLAGFKLAQIAGEAEDTQGKFETVFEGMEKEANAFVDNFSNKFDMADSSIQEWLATLKDTFDPLGVAEEKSFKWGKTLTALALDVKTFYPGIKSVNGAINRFTSYLVGNHEAVREMGVVVNEAMIKTKAYEMGIADTGEELSELQKMTARYKLLLEGLENAQGNAMRELDNFNMAMTQVREIGKETAQEYGENFLPVFTDLLQMTKKLLKWFRDLPESTQNMIAKFTVWSGIIAGIVGPLALIVGYLAQMSVIITEAGGLTAAISGLASTFGPFLIGGVILTGLGYILEKIKQIRDEAKLAKKDISELSSMQEAQEQLKAVRNETKRLEDQQSDSILGSRIASKVHPNSEKLQKLYDKEKRLIEKMGELKAEEEREKAEQAIKQKAREMRNKVKLNEISKEKYKQFLKEQINNKKWSVKTRARLKSELVSMNKKSNKKMKKDTKKTYEEITKAARKHARDLLTLNKISKEEYAEFLKRHAEDKRLSLKTRASFRKEYNSIVSEYEKERARIEKKWANKRALQRKKGMQKELERLEQQKQAAIKNAKEVGARTTDIIKYYEKRKQEIRKKYGKEGEETEPSREIRIFERKNGPDFATDDPSQLKPGEKWEEGRVLPGTKIPKPKKETNDLTSGGQEQGKILSGTDTKATKSGTGIKKLNSIMNKLLAEFKSYVKNSLPNLNSIKKFTKQLVTNFKTYSKNQKLTLKSIKKFSKKQNNNLISIDKKMNKLDSILTALNNLNIDITNKYYNGVNQESSNPNDNLSEKLKNRGVRGSHL